MDQFFNYFYGLSGEDGLIVSVVNEEVQLKLDYEETVMPGDTIRLWLDDSTIIRVTYQGRTEDREPFFTDENGQWYLASDKVYSTNPPSNPPERTDKKFYCFLSGTLIATPDGSAVVEGLSIGDLVVTTEGRAAPVKWIGRQTIMPVFGVPEQRRPVIVAKGALAENVPERDLRLTSDHALLINGMLVQAGSLVNGTTIRRMTLAELGHQFTVYHIELEKHDLILAEGAAAETFVDNVSRRKFDNYAEFEALYGHETLIEEIKLPRVKAYRQLPASIRNLIAERALHADTDELAS